MPRLVCADQGPVEERREGVRVETHAGADRQATLPGQARNPGCPDLPTGDKRQEGSGSALFGAIRGPRPSTDNPPHEKFPAVHSTDCTLNSIIVLIRISYLPVCAIHEFCLQ